MAKKARTERTKKSVSDGERNGKWNDLKLEATAGKGSKRRGWGIGG